MIRITRKCPSTVFTFRNDKYFIPVGEEGAPCGTFGISAEPKKLQWKLGRRRWGEVAAQ